ncbi:MAG: MotA/TolQ/ExbB proton channel family protein [Bacteroidetes bacterium]|nr:MotA/TolQ/ExbB proton channel family protein [Bacteroidota bacterium]
MRKFGTTFGFLLGLISIFGAFLIEGGSAKTLFLLPPILIVFGGTFAATIISVGLDKFLQSFALIYKAYFPVKYDYKKIVSDFFVMSIKSRRDGILSIEKELKEIDYMFPRKLVRYVIDGTDTETLENMAFLEIKAMQERHFSNAGIFTKMGGYAPTMGILGTVMALIMTLANAGSDPNILIKNIASAFIATLWGVLTANLFWLPIGDKLKKCHLEEKNMMELSLEGTMALQSGEIPSVLKARMVSLLPQSEQTEILDFA